MTTRRRFVLSSASVALLAGRHVAASTGDGANEFARIYGRPDLRHPSPDLDFLLRSQESRVRVPLKLGDFKSYIDNLPLIAHLKANPSPELYHLLQWNALALDLTAQDHVANAADAETYGFGEQYGPPRTAWALAIIHLAMFEAVNAIYRTQKSYKGLQAQILASVKTPPAGGITPATTSVKAAIAAAAYGTMTRLYQKKTGYIDVVEAELNRLIDDPASAIVIGQTIGDAAAAAVLSTRGYGPKFVNGQTVYVFDDGSGYQVGTLGIDDEPKFTDLYPAGTPLGVLDWQIDPIVPNSRALGGYWSRVKPFANDPGQLYIPPPAPTDGSADFQAALDEVRQVGGDPGVKTDGAPRWPTPTKRTGMPDAPVAATNQTLKAIFWAYDGTPLLCAPPRLYNMVATSVALRERPISRVDQMAHYLALVNVALADAGIASWAAKYHYHYARPVTYIRNKNPDQVVLGIADAHFTPLGAQASNGPSSSSNLTPPFPSYPSGHAVFGGALFQIMRRYFKGEAAFRFVSDEYNGLNRGPTGDLRPRFERQFPSFTAAETENAQSRVWMGIHWHFDRIAGIKQGRAIADAVYDGKFWS